jgi:hypothetical protein
MYVNTYSGRSYNDINQYPIFPWVLADYESKDLDFKNHAMYRDMTKPVGAFNAKRLAEFEERFKALKESSFDGCDPYMYGGHYSLSANIMNMMVRVEPFTKLLVDLQGGRFDDPNRLFVSLKHLWYSVNNNTNDVRELIPEFFSMPDIFANINKQYFGEREDKISFDLVELPNWASSKEDFILKHRAALESDYITNKLNEWIDLIFGCKQQGEASVLAKNVFSIWTYDNRASVLLPKCEKREKVGRIKQIVYNGRSPWQLFTYPHKKKEIDLNNREGAKPSPIITEPKPASKGGKSTKGKETPDQFDLSTISQQGCQLFFITQFDANIAYLVKTPRFILAILENRDLYLIPYQLNKVMDRVLPDRVASSKLGNLSDLFICASIESNRHNEIVWFLDTEQPSKRLIFLGNFKDGSFRMVRDKEMFPIFFHRVTLNQQTLEILIERSHINQR